MTLKLKRRIVLDFKAGMTCHSLTFVVLSRCQRDKPPYLKFAAANEQVQQTLRDFMIGKFKLATHKNQRVRKDSK